MASGLFLWTKEHQKNVTFDNFSAVFKLNLPPEDYITEKINVQTLEVIFIEFLKTWLSLLSKNLSKIKQNFCKFEGLQPQKMFDSIVYYNDMVYICWTLNNTPLYVDLSKDWKRKVENLKNLCFTC